MMIFILMGRSLVRGSGCLQHYGTVGGHDDQSVLLLAEGTHCDVEWYVDVMCSDRNLALPSSCHVKPLSSCQDQLRPQQDSATVRSNGKSSLIIICDPFDSKFLSADPGEIIVTFMSNGPGAVVAADTRLYVPQAVRLVVKVS
jgi:hypothetical protein